MDPFNAYLVDLRRSRPAGPPGGPDNLVVMCRIPSTNGLARDVVAEYEREAQHLNPFLILAWEQVGGRGRQGRTWMSPAGKGVYATRMLSVEDLEVLQSLPLLVGVGLCRGLAPHLPVPCRLKWPNDLMVETTDGRRKVGGILIEALVRPGEGAAAIIGFGVNHGHGTDELPETGTSLRLLDAHVSLERLTWDLVAGLESELDHLGDAAYAAASYREYTLHQPGDRITCRVGDGTVEGLFAGFDEQGRLLLDRDGGQMRLAAGEVIE